MLIIYFRVSSTILRIFRYVVGDIILSNFFLYISCSILLPLGLSFRDIHKMVKMYPKVNNYPVFSQIIENAQKIVHSVDHSVYTYKGALKSFMCLGPLKVLIRHWRNCDREIIPKAKWESSVIYQLAECLTPIYLELTVQMGGMTSLLNFIILSTFLIYISSLKINIQLWIFNMFTFSTRQLPSLLLHVTVPLDK